MDLNYLSVKNQSSALLIYAQVQQKETSDAYLMSRSGDNEFWFKHTSS